MRLGSAALTFLLLAAPAMRAVELSPPDTTALLARLQASRREHPSARADFIEEKRTRLLREPITSRGTVFFQTPDRFRREVAGDKPSLTVSDGKHLWIYYPAFKEAELYTLGQRAAFDDSIAALTAGLNFVGIEKFYTVTAAREENAYRLRLTPRRGNLRRMIQQLDIWLDDDLTLLRTDLLMPKGDRTITKYSNQKRAPLPAETFQFTPRAGTNITRPLG